MLKLMHYKTRNASCRHILIENQSRRIRQNHSNRDSHYRNDPWFAGLPDLTPYHRSQPAEAGC